MSNESHQDQGKYGVPLPQPHRRFTVFRIEELYTGTDGSGRELPNPDDLIIDYSRNAMWRCKETDYSKYTYKLIPFSPIPEYNSDAIIGACAPSSSDTFRIYVDTSKHPTSLRVDPRLMFAGSSNASIRIFRGTDISDSGEVISGYFNNGRLESTMIPLALARLEGNKTIKSVLPGVCTADVDDGELTTIVVYDDVSEVAAIARCYIVKTSMVLAMESPSRQILDVRLKSPFISPSDDKMLLLPTNIPLDDIPMWAEVSYTDGKRTVNIDGTRAELHGLRNSGSHDTFYISSNVGQKLPLVLSYRIAKGETYLGNDVVEGVINKPHSATTLEVDGAYSVKLFVVPQWLDRDRGYRLNYYLYSLERGNVFDATPYVENGVNAAVFDPTLYGVKQRLIVKVDLSKVSPTYNAHIHPQSFHITLVGPGDENRDNYLIDYVHDEPNYGEGVKALFHYDNVTHWMLDVSCGASSKAEWLQRLYYQSYPLFDHRTEDAPPEPTHFEVITRKKSYIRTIDTWMQPFHVDFQIDAGDVIQLRWIRRTPADELQLGLSPMLAHQKP